ncbi:unnamed protein product [Ectocarpus sp. 6 AP-2014]
MLDVGMLRVELTKASPGRHKMSGGAIRSKQAVTFLANKQNQKKLNEHSS